jgi:hypothetical protein
VVRLRLSRSWRPPTVRQSVLILFTVLNGKQLLNLRQNKLRDSQRGIARCFVIVNVLPKKEMNAVTITLTSVLFAASSVNLIVCYLLR